MQRRRRLVRHRTNLLDLQAESWASGAAIGGEWRVGWSVGVPMAWRGVKSRPSPARDSSFSLASDPNLPPSLTYIINPSFPSPTPLQQDVEARITKVIEEYKQTLMERTELHMG